MNPLLAVREMFIGSRTARRHLVAREQRAHRAAFQVIPGAREHEPCFTNAFARSLGEDSTAGQVAFGFAGFLDLRGLARTGFLAAAVGSMLSGRPVATGAASGSGLK
jgi:hypothetical protein